MQPIAIVTTGRLIADRLSADRLIADRLSADRFTADRLSADRLSADRLIADRLSADRPIADRFIADPALPAPTPKNLQFPAFGAFDNYLASRQFPFEAFKQNPHLPATKVLTGKSDPPLEGVPPAQTSLAA